MVVNLPFVPVGNTLIERSNRDNALIPTSIATFSLTTDSRFPNFGSVTALKYLETQGASIGESAWRFTSDIVYTRDVDASEVFITLNSPPFSPEDDLL